MIDRPQLVHFVMSSGSNSRERNSLTWAHCDSDKVREEVTAESAAQQASKSCSWTRYCEVKLSQSWIPALHGDATVWEGD